MILSTKKLTTWIATLLFAINTSLTLANNNLTRTDSNGELAWTFSDQEVVEEGSLSATLYLYTGEEEDAENFKFHGATILTLVKDGELVAISGLRTHFWGGEVLATELPSSSSAWILSQEDYLYSSPVEWEDVLQGDNFLWEKSALVFSSQLGEGISGTVQGQELGSIVNNSFAGSSQMNSLNYSFESSHLDGTGSDYYLEKFMPTGEDHHTTAAIGVGHALRTVIARVFSTKGIATGTLILGGAGYFDIEKERIRIERERWESDREWRDLQVKKLKMELEQLEWEKQQRDRKGSPDKEKEDDGGDEGKDDGGDGEKTSYNPYPHYDIIPCFSNKMAFFVDNSDDGNSDGDNPDGHNYEHNIPKKEILAHPYNSNCYNFDRHYNPNYNNPPERYNPDCFFPSNGAVDNIDNPNCYNPSHGNPDYGPFMAKVLLENEWGGVPMVNIGGNFLIFDAKLWKKQREKDNEIQKAMEII